MSARPIADIATLTGRSLKHVLRSPDTIISTAVIPIGIMLLFTYVLGGALSTSGGEAGSPEYLAYLLPGVMVMTVTMGVSYTSYRLFLDLKGGIIDRFATMPIARGAILWSHVLTSLAANLVSVALVVGVSLILGFRSGASALAWLAVAGILVLVILALTWAAVIAGLTASSVEGASAFSYPLLILPFVSSAFVPPATMAGPVGWFAEHQPITAVVEAMRHLLAGEAPGEGIWIALAWCVGIGVLAWAIAMALYRRRRG